MLRLCEGIKSGEDEIGVSTVPNRRVHRLLAIARVGLGDWVEIIGP